ncbi:zinc finger protein [Aspergillus leporis]|uniref:Zinc finger protein n=1 Tax=Aspergillus leporis TaxID=41062 RepID=A0A5N5WII5_9EURO|nr:zinc finger protein [Aspergillus leporis]
MYSDYECETCYETFFYEEDCREHMNDYGHWAPRVECDTCYKTFRSQNAANQHMNRAGHWAPTFECDTCSKTFRSQNAANQHMNSTGHWGPRVECETCDSKFFTARDANRHMRAEFHFRDYCHLCDRSFQSNNGLRMHLNSHVHRGRNIPCPFCRANYTTASGLTHHLETASCPNAPKLNRNTILRMIRERDPNGTITNQQIGWHDEETSRYSATNQAFNGDDWECYLCHRLFRTVKALNSHLNSPAHQRNVYHCPNTRARCGKQFRTLAGLFNHLESESCSFMRFEKVQKQIGNVLRGRNLIAFG